MTFQSEKWHFGRKKWHFNQKMTFQSKNEIQIKKWHINQKNNILFIKMTFRKEKKFVSIKKKSHVDHKNDIPIEKMTFQSKIDTSIEKKISSKNDI